MAVPQIGDLIKFGELGWKVYQYGWSDDLNASRQYREFGDDVKHLSQSLDFLSNVINNAKATFYNHRLQPPENVGWDGNTLLDIIGDYDATLNECFALLRTNESYLATTGGARVRNVVWNVMVQPSVDRLRSRIILHNTKVQLVLRPFENDVRLRIYRDLRMRIEDVHDELRGVRRELQALIRAFDPSLAQDLGLQEEVNIEVLVPDDVRQELENAFRLHPDCVLQGTGYNAPLRDVADAFVRIFNVSTQLFNPDERSKEPPRDQYLALLTSQFLMTKMLQAPEARESSGFSHWPSYVRQLRKELSRECQRFNQQMVASAVGYSRPYPTIWPAEEAPAYIESASIPAMMEFLFEIQLETHDAGRWRTMTLLRYCDGTDRRFRILIAAGDAGAPASETLPIEVDISTACLVPRYARYCGTEPLEMVLMLGSKMHPLKFRAREDLYLFQQALTGYKVVDSYMEYRLYVVFVTGSNGMVLEYASMQLWHPMRLDGERIMSDSEQGRLLCSGDPNQRLRTHSVETLRPGRSPPVPGHASQWEPQTPVCELPLAQAQYGPYGSNTSMPTFTSSNSSVFSSSSTASHASTTRPVSVSGGPNLAGTGTLHCRPIEPLLVFFTENKETGRHGIVGVALDQRTGPNFQPCGCLTNAECTDAMIERGRGDEPLDVLRPGDRTRWDILPFAEPLRGRRHGTNTAAGGRVIRVSIRLPGANQRRDFCGGPCNCTVATEGQLMNCLAEFHRGRLGALKELYRRELNNWHSMRYQNQRHVISNQGQQIGMRWN